MSHRYAFAALAFVVAASGLLGNPSGARAADAAATIDQPDRGAREIRRDLDVPISPARAYAMWTSSEGLRSWLVPDSTIDMRIGGAYEPYFAPASAGTGNRGNEGGRVLAFVPNELLAVTWNAPPTVAVLRKQNARTYLVIRFSPASGGGTHLTLVHRNIGTGEAWDAYAHYFEDAWTGVMQAFAAKAG
jgi:uncharacterized protein YndB with AHSA1/START domain